MAISTRDFATFVRDQVTSIQASSSRLVNFTVGSILRALVEANSAVGLWFQGLIIQLFAAMRASTATDSDLDTWMADFGVIRLTAVAANGNVTFSRFTPTMQALITFGSLVKTADGSQSYTVAADTTNPAYTSSGYVIAASTSSLTVPVVASTAGAAGNALTGQVTVLGQAIQYVDTVTNAANFANGAEAETDVQLRARFILYLASLAKATKGAVGDAITSVKAGATYSFVENQQYSGATDYGYFYVVVDDGTGTPTSDFLNSVSNAIEAVRADGIRFGVFAPVVENATVVMTATIAAGYDAVATKALAAATVTSYINSLQLGQALPYTRLAQIAYDASPGITNITGVTLNSGTSDLAATSKQVVKAISVTVN
jgi:hypothetical protein